MDLKTYQQQALETLERYLEALKEAREKADELSALNIDELPEVLQRKQVRRLSTCSKGLSARCMGQLTRSSGIAGHLRGQWAGARFQNTFRVKPLLVNQFRMSV